MDCFCLFYEEGRLDVYVMYITFGLWMDLLLLLLLRLGRKVGGYLL